MNIKHSQKKNEIDMLSGPYAVKLLQVALPIAAMQMLQQFFNAADIAVLGNFAGDTAVAAVGANATVVAALLSLFTGLATGGNVCIARYIGQGEQNKISDALHTIMALSAVSGIFVLLFGQLIAKRILIIMKTPDEILGQATLYLRLYLFAMMFTVIYNFASAILRSKGDTKRPLYALAASGLLNVALNICFVVGLHMDVAGVAIATIVSNGIAAAATVWFLLKEEGNLRFYPNKLRLSKRPLIFVIQIGIPAGLQGMLFTVSNMLIQSGVNEFGSDCMAGNSIAQNYQYVGWFLVNAFGQAVVTFVSQNYGAGNYANCRKVLRYGMLISMSSALFFSVLFVIWSKPCLMIFTASPVVYTFGYIRLLTTTLPEFLTGWYELPAAALRGRGMSLAPTIISILGNVGLRIVWMKTVFVKWHSFLALMMVYPISWVLLGIAMTILYYQQVPKLDK